MGLSDSPVTLQGRLVVLRPISRADYPTLFRWRASMETVHMLNFSRKIVTFEQFVGELAAVGGLIIDPSRCTLGFNAYLGSVGGFLTTSHCTEIQNWVDGRVFYQTSEGDHRIGVETVDPTVWSSQEDANCPAGAYRCRYGDVAFATYDAGVQWSKGFIAKPQQGIQWNGQSWFYVDNHSIPTVGSNVQKVGRTSGWTQGYVTQTCEDIVPYPPPQTLILLCQDAATYLSIGGDSGSAVFQPVSPGSDHVWLSGISWAVLGNESLFSQYAYFTNGMEIGALDDVCACGGGGR